VGTSDRGEVLDILGAKMPVLAGGAFGLVIGQQLVPSGYGVPTHTYDADDELCVILGGEITVAGLSGDRLARAGSSVMLPRAIAYRFRSDGPQPAPMLALLLPPGLAPGAGGDRSARAGQYGVCLA
jgi:hypothetical protein